MEKEAANAVLGRDTGPIELHLAALASERALPDDAVAICQARFEEAAPTLRAVLEKASASSGFSEDEGRLLLRGVYILGGGRDPHSLQALLRLLSRPDVDLHALLGKAIGSDLPRIVAGMFDGDADGLLARITDGSLSDHVRASILGAATFLAWDGRIERERLRSFLVELADAPSTDDEDEVRIAWVMAVGLLGLRDLAPMVKQAWDNGRIPEGVMEWRHFEQDLRDAERAPDDIARLHGAELGYIEDALEALDWTRVADDAPVAGERRPGRGYVPDMPSINPNRGVGRNDPCPCGSGKKYKKCCLAT